LTFNALTLRQRVATHSLLMGISTLSSKVMPLRRLPRKNYSVDFQCCKSQSTTLRQKRERWSSNNPSLRNLPGMATSRFSKKEPTVAKKKKVVRRAWTKEDLRTLKTMAKEQRGAAKIAKALKRTVGATRAMAVKRRVSLSTRG
jgi:hypothetical protein